MTIYIFVFKEDLNGDNRSCAFLFLLGIIMKLAKGLYERGSSSLIEAA